MDNTPKKLEAPEQPDLLPAPQSIEALPSGMSIKRKMTLKKLILIIAASVIGLLLILSVAGWFWYKAQLAPVDSESKELIAVNIASGTTPDAIAAQLVQDGVIRSEFAFGVHTRLTGTQNSLQAGTYRLSPANDTPTIVDHLTKGRVDQFKITFYPGATLIDPTSRPESQKVDVTTVLARAGYTEQEITSALAKDYDHPLFKDKPASADLEGYIYGETYHFNSGATVEDILTRTFDEFYTVITDNNLEAGFKKQGLNLYEGITLASIVQREVITAEDQRQAAQVFFTRLASDMELGSDVTYQYIADKTGVARDPSLDSPYNTRRYGGLPPGPIAVPGLGSLQAVAEPASGNYVYFLSGDDDVTYFARTFEQHEQNIIDHCKIKCASL